MARPCLAVSRDRLSFQGIVCSLSFQGIVCSTYFLARDAAEPTHHRDPKAGPRPRRDQGAPGQAKRTHKNHNREPKTPRNTWTAASKGGKDRGLMGPQSSTARARTRYSAFPAGGKSGCSQKYVFGTKVSQSRSRRNYTGTYSDVSWRESSLLMGDPASAMGAWISLV